MLAFSPRPLPAELALQALLTRAPSASPLGVWFLSRRPFTVSIVRARQRVVFRVDGDLGRLLRCSAAVMVRLGREVIPLSPEELNRARALRIVAGSRRLPSVGALHALFSDARDVPSGLEIPLARRSAEEVLAACAAAEAPVLSSRIVYDRISRS